MVRTLALAGVFQAAGAAFFVGAVSARGCCDPGGASGGWDATAALAGWRCSPHSSGCGGARLADGYAGLVDPALQRLAWGGSGGHAAWLQLTGLAVIACGLARQGRTAAGLAGAGAAIAACAFALTGHTSEHAPRALLAPLLCVHLLVVAFWFGALLPLFICSRHETRADAVALLRAFSGVAGWLVPAIGSPDLRWRSC